MPTARGDRRAGRRPPLTVEALWAIKRLAPPTLSPDGAFACAAVTSFDMEKNDSATELWLFPTGLAAAPQAKARRLSAGDKDSDPKWSPDGRWIAFTAKRKDDEEPQIYLIAPDGGEAKRLTVARDGLRRAQVVSRRQAHRVRLLGLAGPREPTQQQAKRKKERKDAKVKAHITERAEFRFWDRWLTDGREPHVMICDVATGRCRDALAGTGLALPPWDPTAADFDIAPDGRQLALTADLAPEPRMMNQRDIVTVDLATRSKRVLTADTGTDDAWPSYSPDGRSLVFHSYDTGAFVQRPGTADAPRAPERTHAARSLRDSTGRSRASPGRRIRARCSSPAKIAVAWDSGGSRCTRRSLPERRRSSSREAASAASRSRATARCSRSTARRRPIRRRSSRAGRTDPGSARSRTLNRALFARHALGDVREVTIKGWGGAPVQMWITYPPNFDPKKKWPLLHSIHGGPHAAHLDALALPLEHAGVRRARLRRRGGELPRLVGIRAEVAGDDHRPVRREGVRRHRGRDRLAAAAGLHRPARGSSRPAAATAASWSRT